MCADQVPALGSLGHLASLTLAKKTISWPLAPAPESKDPGRIGN
jgi:hypothetical protein